MKKIIYLVAAGLGGMWIGKILYTIYAYIQVITIHDTVVEGLLWYQVAGFVIGLAIGRYWQTHYEYWSSMSFMPTQIRN